MFDVAKSGVQFGVFVQVAEWCNFPHNAFWLFYLHLALFTCTELIISALRSVGILALCLHSHLHLLALGATRACNGKGCCVSWLGVCRHRGTGAAVAPIGFTRSLY